MRRPPVAAWDKVAVHGAHIPRRIILHSTESHDAAGISDLQGVIGFWWRQGLGYGAHLLIDKDGNAALAADPEFITWHTYKRNTGSIGIELIGFARFVPKLWWARPKQLIAVARWLAYLSSEYGIPLKFDARHGVSRHVDQSRAFGGSHWDPGPFFPIRWVIRRAQREKRRGALSR